MRREITTCTIARYTRKPVFQGGRPDQLQGEHDHDQPLSCLVKPSSGLASCIGSFHFLTVATGLSEVDALSAGGEGDSSGRLLWLPIIKGVSVGANDLSSCTDSALVKR
jgi:hypothetical protein